MTDDTPDPGDRYDASEIREALIVGLVGSNGDLYRNSPSFHAQIEMLANMLPLWVRGMAAEAKNSDFEYARIRAMQTIDLPTPLCLCGHRKIRHTADNACLDCTMPHPFSPRWVLIQCPAIIPHSVAEKTGMKAGLRCLKEHDAHARTGDGHVALDGEQWVAWI